MRRMSARRTIEGGKSAVSCSPLLARRANRFIQQWPRRQFRRYALAIPAICLWHELAPIGSKGHSALGVTIGLSMRESSLTSTDFTVTQPT